MKTNTGIIRRLDDLRRIVIPKEFRKILEINQRDYIEISMQGDLVILNKYQNKCVFCGKVNPGITFEGKKICNTCIENLKKKGNKR